MKKKMTLVVLILAFLFVISGCANKEEKYKEAIDEHMRGHHLYVDSYNSFHMGEYGANAEVAVPVSLQMGGTIDLKISLHLNTDYEVTSCSWCDTKDLLT